MEVVISPILSDGLSKNASVYRPINALESDIVAVGVCSVDESENTAEFLSRLGCKLWIGVS
jgi:hypothetical protein